MSGKKLEELAGLGQSIWLDNISREMIEDGRLGERIGTGLRGMTSNPTIFDKSISSSSDYDKAIRELAIQGDSTFEIYDELTVRDVRDAADLFLPVHEKTGGLDGYVSLEINPQLALEAEETINEGQRLFSKVDRPNVMYKVPSTDAGFPAIEELVSEGINVNITLIFSLDQYRKAAAAYVRGIRRLIDRGEDPRSVHSVASVFVSRIDTAVDKLIDEISSQERDLERKSKLTSLRGKAAVANSDTIFQEYEKIFFGEVFDPLKEKGVNIQRVLWGSTGTKDPGYSDVKYVTELIGRNTVNTLPDKTLDAFLDHGTVKHSLPGNSGEAHNILKELTGFGIDVDEVCLRLLDEGVKSFQNSFESLLQSIEKKRG
jgi:transaldolase